MPLPTHPAINPPIHAESSNVSPIANRISHQRPTLRWHL